MTKFKKSDPPLGMHELIDLERMRTARASMAFGAIAFVILFSVSAINFFLESSQLVWFTFPIALIIAACLVYIRLSGQTSHVLHVYGTLMVLMSAVLIYTGGVRGNGHLWLFCFPPFCYFLMGLRYGSMYFLALLGAAALVFFLPNIHSTAYPYGNAFAIRFLMAMAGVAAMSAWYEIVRQRMQIALVDCCQRSEERARHDEHTGLLNRRGGMILINHYGHVASRHSEACTVMMIDIDYFKGINDTYGHAVGDEVLKEMSQLLRSVIRSEDVCMRWGGEEFLVLLPRTDLAGGRRVAINLLEKLRSAPLATSAGPINISCSIGVAELDSDEDLKQTIERADELLYAAKRDGRDCFKCQSRRLPSASPPPTSLPISI